MLQEEELIEGCRKGNRAFQKALYDRYCRKMMVVCLRYAKSTPEAEDILQEGFIKVFAGIENFRKESKLETWITRIMVNTALNHQRKKLYLFPMVDVEEIDLPEDEISISGINLTQLLELIQSLPQGCQIVFNLFAIEGYSHKEIAEQLGISEGTSKSQFARAKALLQKKLSKESAYYHKYGEAKV
ncbi:MAG: RNA polymerase sigma factor [Bacteroidia bacterium]|nr:RNA polymerase sigma factor [Bacteroidia bacterium]